MNHCSIIVLVLLKFIGTFYAQMLENVAFGKKCNQSSIYTDQGKGNDCSCAINGNKHTTYIAGDCISTGNCVHTDLGDSSPRWFVDLGQTYTIQKITVIGRDGAYGLPRLRDVVVSVDQTEVYTYPSDQQWINIVTNITSSGGNLPRSGRYVTLSATTSDGLLNICEVEVWVLAADIDECASNPCQNGGGCTGGGSSYTCSCLNGYTGANCQTDIDECASILCLNGGSCINGVASYTCTCLNGYTGANCQTDINECDSSPCQNGGRCNNRVATYTCTCFNGYTGANCQSDINECDSNPCQNGGRCNNLVASYTCTCLNGYTGASCQSDVNECDSNPCQNGGRCNNGVASYTCTCLNGYTGVICQTDINECASNPCLNNGTCNQGVAYYTCSCGQGYTGKNCQANIDECSSRPCHNNGTCVDGVASYTCTCSSGYTGDNCDTDIDDCASNNCTNGGLCVDGAATYSCNCTDRYNGTYCEIALPQIEGPETSSTKAIGAGVGAAVAVVLVVILVILIVRYRRKSIKANKDPNTQGMFADVNSREIDTNSRRLENKPKAAVKPRVRLSVNETSEENGNTNDNANVSQADHLYGNINTVATSSPSKPPVAAKPDRLKNRATEYINLQGTERKNPITTEHSKHKMPTRKVDCLSGVQSEARKSVSEREDSDEDLTAEDVYNNGSLYACYSSIEKAVSLIDDFQRRLLDRISTPNLLEAEFEAFPKGMLFSHDVGIDPKNQRKNRFQKLCAYDKNRVVLKRPKNDPDTDYINASWIKSPDNDQAYIATQGPRVNTISDLWWMVWQENVTQIVMLTNLQEDGKDKCEEYWPTIGATATYGHVVVKSQNVDERADFIVRTFIINVKGEKDEERLVYQYHYVAWPDHGVPVAGSLAQFWYYVTARATSGAPPVIHCSAGVGRTGTYIALDIAMARMSRGDDVNIHDIVMGLRDQRSIMVQTVVQYTFLHEVILEAYTSRNSRLTADQLDLRFPTDIDINATNKTIDNEFKLLTEIKEWAKPKHQTALLAENRYKNRDQDVLPDDDHMVYLNVYVKGRNQYINATYLSSFRRRRGLLLTQLPLPHTLVDLWRLVEGCDVTTIISLGSKNDDKRVKDFRTYWPRFSAEELTVYSYEITFNSSTKVNSHLTTYSLNMKHKDKTQTVNIIHYTDWSGEVPGNISDVIYLVNLVRNASEDSDAPILIQCLDGATRSGLFCVLYDVFCRMTSDDEVSILPIVRQVQCVRRKAVSSEKQYRYLYKVAQEFKRSQSVYANAS